MTKSRVTVYYTQNIRGQLYLLPRIATLLKRLKAETEGRILLLDAGDSCHERIDLCEQTGGRASVIMLDSIGYHAVNVTGLLAPGSREKLEANYLNVALVDEAHPYVHDGIAYAAQPPRNGPVPVLHIALTPGMDDHIMPEMTRGYTYTLRLRSVGAGEVGCVTIAVNEEETSLLQSSVYLLTPGIPPDPTISAALDFVYSEARYYSRKRGDNS